MSIYLGLGSNQGDRRENLTRALSRLEQGGFNIRRISPVVESPALLADNAEPDWNRPYLNLVLEGDTQLGPEQTLALAKQIEQALGRNLDAPRWSPRPIDIDLLLWHEECIRLPELTIPHPEMHKRSFVITPLMHLEPNLALPGMGLTPLQISQQIRPLPLWMGIVNLTPDSFSDGGTHEEPDALEQQLEAWIEAGVQILDLGAESTRPGADSITLSEERSRLSAVFKILKSLRTRHRLMPLVSIDTRHPEVAKWALESGADWVNDVTGLADQRMLEVVRECASGAVAMHSLSVPVIPGEYLDSQRPVAQQLIEWLGERRNSWHAAGLALDRIVFDPGVGFGKNALQNLEIIRQTAALRSHGFRLLIGHSRKSFMNSFSEQAFAGRDIETLGISLAMCAQGVDIIRVHDPLGHLRAWRAWVQVES